MQATTRLEDRTTYRDYFTETGVLRPPTRSLGVKATIDLTHGRNHAKTSAMRRAKALMEEQVREGTLSGR